MQLIYHPLSSLNQQPENTVKLITSRLQLQKRIWRGLAEDGKVFGFDLEEPLSHDQPFYECEGSLYVLKQEAEAVYAIDLITLKQAAETAWMIGNLHFSVSFHEDTLIVPVDPALEKLFIEQSITYREENMIFLPKKNRTAHKH